MTPPTIATPPGDIPIWQGRRIIEARFPSSRAGQGPWPLTIDDSGVVIAHDCPAHANGRACWHVAPQAVEATLDAFWRQVYAETSDRERRERLAWLDHYLAVCGGSIDAPERAAVDYERATLGALLAESEREAA